MLVHLVPLPRTSDVDGVVEVFACGIVHSPTGGEKRDNPLRGRGHG